MKPLPPFFWYLWLMVLVYHLEWLCWAPLQPQEQTTPTGPEVTPTKRCEKCHGMAGLWRIRIPSTNSQAQAKDPTSPGRDLMDL